MSADLGCMNCKKATPPDKSKFFAEVFLCEDCHVQAVHFYARLELELKNLLVMSKEAIRISLITGQFSFPEGQAGETSKKAVLEQILLLEEARSAHKKAQ